MEAQLFTDGSCIGNPGPGAWAFLIRTPTGAGNKSEEVRKQDGEPYTTNNRMELTAVIEGLKWLAKNHPKIAEITIYSDSSWVINTMTKNWKRKKNLDLWELLLPLLPGKKIKWQWVRGHNGHKENEDCDVRAQRESLRQLKNAGNMPRPLPGDKATLFD